MVAKIISLVETAEVFDKLDRRMCISVFGHYCGKNKSMICYIKIKLRQAQGKCKGQHSMQMAAERSSHSYGCWQFPHLQYQTLNTLKFACEVPQGF